MPNGGVSWKWLVSILVVIVMALAGTSFKAVETRSLKNETKIAVLDVELHQEKIRNEVQYRAIERRLDELQASINKLDVLIRQQRGFR